MKIVPGREADLNMTFEEEIDNLQASMPYKLSSKCHLDASSCKNTRKSRQRRWFDKFKAFVEKGGNDVELVAAFRKYVMYPPDWAYFKKELKL